MTPLMKTCLWCVIPVTLSGLICAISHNSYENAVEKRLGMEKLAIQTYCDMFAIPPATYKDAVTMMGNTINAKQDELNWRKDKIQENKLPHNNSLQLSPEQSRQLNELQVTLNRYVGIRDTDTAYYKGEWRTVGKVRELIRLERERILKPVEQHGELSGDADDDSAVIPH